MVLEAQNVLPSAVGVGSPSGEQIDVGPEELRTEQDMQSGLQRRNKHAARKKKSRFQSRRMHAARIYIHYTILWESLSSKLRRSNLCAEKTNQNTPRNWLGG